MHKHHELSIFLTNKIGGEKTTFRLDDVVIKHTVHPAFDLGFVTITIFVGSHLDLSHYLPKKDI